MEGVPELAAAARRNRPKATVVNAALVSEACVTEVTMKTANLMSIVKGAPGSDASDEAHVRSGAEVQRGIEVRELHVPAGTLTASCARPASTSSPWTWRGMSSRC